MVCFHPNNFSLSLCYSVYLDVPPPLRKRLIQLASGSTAVSLPLHFILLLVAVIFASRLPKHGC